MVRSDSGTAAVPMLMMVNSGWGLPLWALGSLHLYCNRKTPQMVPVQTLGAAQSVVCVATVQLVRQTFAAMLQLKPPAHRPLAEVWHVPAPLHRRGWTWVAPVLQEAATQRVPLAKSRHAPDPSQVPSVVQLAAP